MIVKRQAKTHVIKERMTDLLMKQTNFNIWNKLETGKHQRKMIVTGMTVHRHQTENKECEK